MKSLNTVFYRNSFSQITGDKSRTYFYILIFQDRGVVLQFLVYMRTDKLGNFRAHAVLKHKTVLSVLRKEHHISLSIFCCSTVQTVAEYKTRMAFQYEIRREHFPIPTLPHPIADTTTNYRSGRSRVSSRKSLGKVVVQECCWFQCKSKHTYR